MDTSVKVTMGKWKSFQIFKFVHALNFGSGLMYSAAN